MPSVVRRVLPRITFHVSRFTYYQLLVRRKEREKVLATAANRTRPRPGLHPLWLLLGFGLLLLAGQFSGTPSGATSTTGIPAGTAANAVVVASIDGATPT